jgi:DNA-binding NarL/FixJ family response regulator
MGRVAAFAFSDVNAPAARDGPEGPATADLHVYAAPRWGRPARTRKASRMAPDDERQRETGTPHRGRRTGDAPLRVLLVDDHTLFRTGLRNLLEDRGFEVIEARSGELAVGVVAGSVPDVVLMDLHMPGMSGVEATRRVARAAPTSRVLMLTVSGDQEDIVDAILAGACGYLIKDASVADIESSIRAAADGASWVSPRVASVLLERVREAGERPAHDPALVQLSDREREILRLIAEGCDNAEIGRRLYISPKTVKNHVSSLLAKLQMENRIQAAVYAVRRGLA